MLQRRSGASTHDSKTAIIIISFYLLAFIGYEQGLWFQKGCLYLEHIAKPSAPLLSDSLGLPPIRI